MSEKKYTYAQVKEHNKAEDLWMVVDDKVYDVTKFLNEVGTSIMCFYLIPVNYCLISQISILAVKKFSLTQLEKMVMETFIKYIANLY